MLLLLLFELPAEDFFDVSHWQKLPTYNCNCSPFSTAVPSLIYTPRALLRSALIIAHIAKRVPRSTRWPLLISVSCISAYTLLHLVIICVRPRFMQSTHHPTLLYNYHTNSILSNMYRIKSKRRVFTITQS